MNRAQFLAGAAALSGIGALPFPGEYAIFAQRLADPKPFEVRDATAIMPSASIIKLYILAAVEQQVRARSLSWSTTLPIPSHAIVASSAIFEHAAPGSVASIDALCAAMIEQSDNTAGNVLADWTGFDAVNAVAQRSGLPATRLRRHFMDFAARARGIDNTTSAADMGRFLLDAGRAARRGDADARRTVGYMLKQRDRKTIPAGIGRRVPVANKTGDLPDVRHDVAIVDPYGAHPYVLVLMSSRLRDQPRALIDLASIAREIDRRAMSS